MVDPSGREEPALAAEYRNRAEAVESGGYHRLAGTLRELADEYNREAEQMGREVDGEQ